MELIRVVVFDDNKPRRELLQLLLNSSDGLTCIAAFEDCRDIVKNISSNTPDLVLMDIDMPHVNGIEGMKLIKQYFPRVKIMMQTIFEDDEKIFDAIMAGADGYILKKTTPVRLLEAITDIMNGGSPMTSTVARKVLQLFMSKNRRTNTMDFDLTDREQEILGLLVKGLSYKMIAARCNISYTTVNSHIKHIYEKLHVNSGTEAVAKAIEYKIV